MNKIKISITIITIATGFIFSGCSSKEAPKEQVAAQVNHTEESHSANEGEAQNHTGSLQELKLSLTENEVLVTEKQMETVDIILGKISNQQLSHRVKSFGEIALAPSDEASVSAVIGGIIRDIRVIEGDYVKKGQVIARIEHPDIVDMQQNYLEVLNRDEYLETEFKRQKRLLQDSVNSAKTFQNVKAEYQSNLAQLLSLKQKLQLIHVNAGELSPGNIEASYPLRAPISGYVGQVKVNTGRHITPQQSLFHITANEKAHIDLNVYEKDIAKIEVGQMLTFIPVNNQGAQPLEGQVMKMAKRFDPEQRTALVHASISEINENLLPGMSVIAYIQTGGQKQSTLPEGAFVADQGGNYVFLLKKQGVIENEHEQTGEEEHVHENEAVHEETPADENEAGHNGATQYSVFERILVRKGITEGGFTSFSLDETVASGARFVVNNAQTLMSEMKKGAASHSGHAH